MPIPLLPRHVVVICALTVACSSATGPDDERPAPEDHATPVALDVLGRDTYLGLEGGLYLDGSNTMPADHRAEALRRLALVRPRDASGAPSATGRIVLLSVGYSNASQEFCAVAAYTSCTAWSFMGQASAAPDVNHTSLTIVNGARGGQTSVHWDAPDDPNYERIRVEGLAPLGLSEAQVQIVWIKVATSYPTTSLPAADADAYALLADWGEILRTLRMRYPNLQLVFASTRTYGGFATVELSPEPFAFETGFAVKWAIEAQIRQNRSGTTPSGPAGDLGYDRTPWLGWGPYLWALGQPDPLTAWTRADFIADGVHPSRAGQEKVVAMLLAFFRTSELAQCWFLAERSCD
jgi:lysophospholipase L1-like esterase